MVDNDPAKIKEMANEVMSDPYEYTDLARKYCEKDTDLPFYVFGAIGIPMLAMSYRSARETQLNNLEAATRLVKEAAQGLARTAANWEKADHVSTPVGRKDLPGYTEPSGTHAGYIREGTELAILGTAFGLAKLLAMHVTGKKLLKQIGNLEKTAYPAMAIWLLTIPWDDPIDKAVAAWNAVSVQLGSGKDALDGAVDGIDEAWADGDDRKSFESWLARFLPEYDDASQAATKTGEALNDAKQAIMLLQLGFLAFAVVMLGTIIALSAAKKLPYIGPVANVMSMIAGVMVAVGTVGVVGGMATTLSALLGALPALLTGNFGKLQVNAGGGGVGFTDVGVNWDDKLNNIKID